jgi:hypothetical protein
MEYVGVLVRAMDYRIRKCVGVDVDQLRDVEENRNEGKRNINSSTRMTHTPIDA